MPNRILKESIRTSDTIGELSWFEEVLFYRIIVSCDDYGRFDGRIPIIKGSCFPLKDVTNKTIEDALNKLATVGLVRRYEVVGKPYLQLSTWQQHQSIRAKKSKYPSPDECDMKSSANNYNHMHADVPVIQSESNPNPNPNTESIERIVCAWNELEKYGIKPVKKLDKTSKRYQNLQARLNDNGLSDVLQAIENVKKSDYLQGKINNWKITFDWFVLPNNYTKVSEGQYEDSKQKKDSVIVRNALIARRICLN